MPDIFIDEITNSVTDKIDMELQKYTEQIDSLPINETWKLKVKAGLTPSVSKRNRVKLLYKATTTERYRREIKL